MAGRIEYFDDPDAPEPNALVPACGTLAVNEQGEMLLQRRRDTGQWALPMGKQEIGESPSECAVRETLEETGVEVAVIGFVGIYSDPRHIVAYSDGEVRQEYEVTLLVCRVRDPLTVQRVDLGCVVVVSAQCGDSRGRRLGAGPVVVRDLSCRPVSPIDGGLSGPVTAPSAGLDSPTSM